MKKLLLNVAIAALALIPTGDLRQHSTASKSAAPHLALDAAYGKLPLAFEANEGQLDAEVKFLSRGSGYSLFLTDSEAVLRLTRSSAGPAASSVAAGVKGHGRRAVQSALLKMKLLGASAERKVVCSERLPGLVNYFVGDEPTKWRTDVAIYAKAEFKDVYPGINLVYYGNHRQLEYDYVVAPGADPNRIRLGFEGADSLHIDEQGDIVAATALGEVRWLKPVIYQQVGDRREPVAGAYELHDRHEVTFRIASYDATRPFD